MLSTTVRSSPFARCKGGSDDEAHMTMLRTNAYWGSQAIRSRWPASQRLALVGARLLWRCQIAVAAWLVFVFNQLAFGATLTVCPAACDHQTIQGAVDAAVANDIIALQMISPHTEAGIVLNKNLTIAGAGSLFTTVQASDVVDGALDRVFHIVAGTAVTLSGLTVRFGRANDDSGGAIRNDGVLTLDDVAVLSNRATGSATQNGLGGGIYSTGTLRATGVVLSDNEGRLGGGIYAEGSLVLADVVVAENRAFIGGGLSAIDAEVELERFAVSRNTAAEGGGLLLRRSAVRLARGSIDRNLANGLGGGLVVDSGDVYVTNTTIANNASEAAGGGVFVNRGSLALANATIVRNTADINNSGSNASLASEGGGLFHNPFAVSETTTRLFSTIIAENSLGGSGQYPDCYGTFNFGSHSLIGDTGPLFGLPCAVDGITTGMQYGVSPQLLTAAGEDADRVVTIFSASPAIDAGSCIAALGPPITTDQRGYLAPVDGDALNGPECDIGAFEFGSVLDDLFSDGFE